jgi:hypothetical protein
VIVAAVIVAVDICARQRLELAETAISSYKE